MIPELRTNSLILLGPAKALKKIEEFITHYVDKKLDLPFAPIHTYQLKYTDSEAVAKIITDVVQFHGGSNEAQKSGGVRSGEKYFKDVSIVSEKSGNRLIITSSYDDFLKIKELIEKIDVEQPQIALKVFILSVDIIDDRTIGSQIRNKIPTLEALLGKSINFQTSGLNGSPIIENTMATIPPGGEVGGAYKLLGNLLNIARNILTPGNTMISLGTDAFGVWGLLQLLQTYSHVDVVANPFIVTTNRQPAIISVGETRRIVTGKIVTASATPTYGDKDAKLTVNIVPQISYEGYITLTIKIEVNDFTSTDVESGNTIERSINTNVIIKNREFLALGGILKDKIIETESKVPILGNIPILKWLFTNKSKSSQKSSIIILILPEIIPTNIHENTLTREAIDSLRSNILSTKSSAGARDPIDRMFFKAHETPIIDIMDSFEKSSHKYVSKYAHKDEVDLGNSLDHFVEPKKTKP